MSTWNCDRLSLASGNRKIKTWTFVNCLPAILSRFIYLSTPTIRNWWSQCRVMATSHCHIQWRWWSHTLWHSQGQTALNSSSVCFVLAKTDITVPSKCYCGIFPLSHRCRSEVTSWKVPKMVDHGFHRLHNGLRVLGYRWYIKNDSNSLGTVSDCVDNVGMFGNLQDLVMAATSFILAVSDTPFVSCFKVCELWQCSSGRICHTRS